MNHDILIIDDEKDIRTLVAGILTDEGHKCREASNADEALAAIRSRCPSLVILDIWLQGSRLDGLQLLDELKGKYTHLPVIVISGHGTIKTAVAAIKKGAYDFIEKPFKADRLLLMVDKAMEATKLRRENEELRLRAGGPSELIGESAAIQNLRQVIMRVAPTGSRILITGRAGVGKELVARSIHAQSQRSEGPFVVLNCAALEPENLETKLFGIEGGEGEPRFLGLLEQAHGGTLLLDEVADMPLETQGKIVRALQEQNFLRVNGSHKVQVDVRVMAATSHDLKAEIEAGHFRQDLFYRLNVVPIQVPSLTERREDIPLLARHFMSLAANAAGVPVPVFGEDAVAVLQSYDWPGNVRQLRNVVDWLLIMTKGEDKSLIQASMLPPDIGTKAPAVLQWDKASQLMTLPLREARELFEREYLLTQLGRFGGNVSRTASFIGMERSALHRKLKALGARELTAEEIQE